MLLIKEIGCRATRSARNYGERAHMAVSSRVLTCVKRVQGHGLEFRPSAQW
jgi:hypothetical protein